MFGRIKMRLFRSTPRRKVSGSQFWLGFCCAAAWFSLLGLEDKFQASVGSKSSAVLRQFHGEQCYDIVLHFRRPRSRSCTATKYCSRMLFTDTVVTLCQSISTVVFNVRRCDPASVSMGFIFWKLLNATDAGDGTGAPHRNSSLLAVQKKLETGCLKN